MTELWWNRTQILKDQGFDPASFSNKEADTLLQDILSDNRTQFGHEYKEEKAQSGNPLLHKYFYVKDDGVNRSWLSRTAKKFTETADLKEKEVKEIKDTSGSCKVVVKCENPMFSEFKQKLAVLTSAKATLDKLDSNMADLQCHLKNSGQPGCGEQARKVGEAHKQVQELLPKVRAEVIKGGKVDASCDGLEGMIKNIVELCEMAMIHNDGFKLMKKRSVAMMGA